MILIIIIKRENKTEMKKGRMKKRSRMFFAMLLSFLLIMGMGMSASAEEIIYGVPYATVIAVLKAEAQIGRAHV